MEPDEVLVAAFLDGDESAFEELVKRYEAKIRQLAHGYLRRREMAEDVAQDTFLQAYQKLHTLGHHVAFRSWLYRIAVNRCHDELRRLARQADLPPEDELDGELRRASGPLSREAPLDGERLLLSRQVGRRLSRSLAGLPEKQRTPLVLKEVLGMTYAEIAELLGWPLGTVQIRIHRARLKLRGELGDLLDDQESGVEEESS